jgi:hypothetical protein
LISEGATGSITTWNMKREPNVATGLFVTDDGNVMVDYGKKKIPIPLAQYKANGYRPRFEELMLRVQAEQRLRSVSLPEQETTRTQPARKK